MTPQLTPSELEQKRKLCAEALELSKWASGVERMRLIHSAFPFSITGALTKGKLIIAWDSIQGEFTISDWGGFLTRTPDSLEMLQVLKDEAERPGYLRFLLTGKMPRERTVEKKIKKKFSLSELGLS